MLRHKKLVVIGGCLVAMLCVGLSASAQVTLPTTGIAVDDYVDAFGTGVAVPITAIVGLFFAFLIIRKALKWSNKAA